MENITKRLRLGGLNRRNIFLIDLEAMRSKKEILAKSVSF